jgi:hypothetical protein
MRLLIAKAVGTSSLFAGTVSNNWLDQWYQAKDGRTSLDQHVQQLEDTTTVYYDNSAPGNSWLHDLYMEKTGQSPFNR